MKIYIAYFLFFWGLITVNAQLKGKVIIKDSEPLAYASVVVFLPTGELVNGVISDDKGFFKLSNLQPGTYQIAISFVGYQTKEIKQVNILANKQSVDLGLVILEESTNLKAVVITGQKSVNLHKVDREVFDATQLQVAQGGTGIDIVKNLPSVNLDGQGALTIRGASGFVLMVNGKPMQGDVTAFLSQIPANAIDKVEFITAPAAKYDPEGTAGMLNLITKKGQLNGAYGQINTKGGFPSIETYGNQKYHQRYGADGTYNLRNDKWNISMGAAYLRNDIGGRRVGDVYTIVGGTKTSFPSVGERSTDEINYNGRFTIDFTPNNQNNFSFGLYAGKRYKERLADIYYFDNHANTPVDNPMRDYTFQYFNHNISVRKGDFALASLDYQHTYFNKSKLSTSFLYEYTLLGGPTTNQNLGYSNPSVLYQDEYNTNNNPLNGIRYQLDYIFKPLPIGLIEVGYQFRNLVHNGEFVYERRTSFNDPFTIVPENSSTVNLNRAIHAAYGQLTGTQERWQYNAGARVEHMNRSLYLKDVAGTIDKTYQYNFTKLYPSASVQYEVDAKTNVKLAYSKRVERTTTFKMNPFPEREHSETWEQGDPNLKPEFIDLVELGYFKKFKNANQLSATLYYRNVQNLVNRVNTVAYDTILNRIYSNVGNAKSVGLEVGSQLQLTKNLKNYLGVNFYNYVIKGSFDNKPIDTQSLVYSVNLNTTYQFWKNASLQFTFNYLSDRVTAQGEDSRFYNPNLTLSKSFYNNRLTASLQWLNIDMGLLNSNEQRITTYRANDFYTTTNYIYEVDMVMLNLSYVFKNGKNKTKFVESEFGKREF